MELLLLNKVAGHWHLLCRDLPLSLRGESSASPARVGIGLEVADMAHRLIWSDLAQSAQGHLIPATILLLPVQWSLPALALYCIPATREPEQGIGIASI